eukprot:640349-Rhodomonas_salina.2
MSGGNPRSWSAEGRTASPTLRASWTRKSPCRSMATSIAARRPVSSKPASSQRALPAAWTAKRSACTRSFQLFAREYSPSSTSAQCAHARTCRPSVGCGQRQCVRRAAHTVSAAPDMAHNATAQDHTRSRTPAIQKT